MIKDFEINNLYIFGKNYKIFKYQGREIVC